MSVRPYPVPDLDSAPWWEALQRRELVVQSCMSCGRLRWPARTICNECGGDLAEWIPASGRGTIASWTVTHQSFGPTIEVPFVVALVRLADQDDILIPGYVDGPQDGSGLELGGAVELGFQEVVAGDDDQHLMVLRWRRTT